jgi:hypothetical protein
VQYKTNTNQSVIPAKAGIQQFLYALDAGSGPA